MLAENKTQLFNTLIIPKVKHGDGRMMIRDCFFNSRNLAQPHTYPLTSSINQPEGSTDRLVATVGKTALKHK